MSDENRVKNQSVEPGKPASAPAYRTLTPGTATKPASVAPKPAAAPAKPVPTPAVKADQAKEPAHDDPTRFGDWEIKGRCIDF
jgi:hypothetical protein